MRKSCSDSPERLVRRFRSDEKNDQGTFEPTTSLSLPLFYLCQVKIGGSGVRPDEGRQEGKGEGRGGEREEEGKTKRNPKVR